MTDLMTFDYSDRAVRTVLRDHEPWFVATDIASILGYRNAPDMVRMLDDDEADTHNLRSGGEHRQHSIISESGLYNAIFRSRRPEARAFRKWVTGTVLPTLRRTGGFSLASAPIHADAAHLNACVAAVREARRLFGPGIAAAIWRDLGLPLPDAPVAIADGLADAVRLWAEGRDRFTNDELAAGIGLGSPDAALRGRFADILRGDQWVLRRTRRGRALVRAWHRATTYSPSASS